jgi:hypothetical protein
VPPISGGTAFRINKGDTFALLYGNLGTTATGVAGQIRVEYDNGKRDEFYLQAAAAAAGKGNVQPNGMKTALEDGWVVSLFVFTTGTQPSPGGFYCTAVIVKPGTLGGAEVYEVLATGYVGSAQYLILGTNIPSGFNATWVFQGTIAEDATGGTHDCTLTVTPGVGQELQLIYGQVAVGNTATAQVSNAHITDGTNELFEFFNQSTTTASLEVDFPTGPAGVVQNATIIPVPSGGYPLTVSGSMQLVLEVSTTAVSVTQTFAVVCRLKSTGPLPTATLADTVGSPTLTTNTNAVF